MNKMRRVLILGAVDYLILCISYFLTSIILGSWYFNSVFAYMHMSFSAIIGLSMLFLLIIYVFTSWVFGINTVIWRYSNEKNYLVVFCTIMITNAVFFAVSRLFGITINSMVYLIAALISSCGSTAARVIYKLVSRYRHTNGSIFLNLVSAHERLPEGKKRLLIVGAGVSASMMLGELMNSDNESDLYPVAIVDDDDTKLGRTIYGVKVVGKTVDIPDICTEYDAQIIYIAIPSASNSERAVIIEECQKTGLPVKILPHYTEIADDDSGFVNKVRDITPEELLGREPINVADEGIYNFISGKTVVITGGGGSIGSELCRQIAAHSPGRLIIIDIYENNAYAIQQELKMKYGSALNLQVYIASVREQAKIDYLFSVERPDIVFHAAAHKHVPLMEVSPDEAVKNNVFGTYNTALAAKNNGVKRFVLVSTDKAVNPTNCMGATKRICEMVIQYFNSISEGATTYAAVRFGNVLGSNGSVIPLFKEQIKNRLDVTVTDPRIIRYFMTIPEASQLVLTAGAMASGGEIFVLDMGEPVKIDDLARKMIKLSGLVEGRDIHIRYTGLRPGEKLFEELLVGEEGLKKTLNAKIFISSIMPVDFVKLKGQLDELKTLVSDVSVDADTVAAKLAEVVPTFKRYVPENKAQK